MICHKHNERQRKLGKLSKKMLALSSILHFSLLFFSLDTHINCPIHSVWNFQNVISTSVFAKQKKIYKQKCVVRRRRQWFSFWCWATNRDLFMQMEKEWKKSSLNIVYVSAFSSNAITMYLAIVIYAIHLPVACLHKYHIKLLPVNAEKKKFFFL